MSSIPEEDPTEKREPMPLGPSEQRANVTIQFTIHAKDEYFFQRYKTLILEEIDALLQRRSRVVADIAVVVTS